MLSLNPKDRPSAHEILQHAYFKEVHEALGPLFQEASPMKGMGAFAETDDVKYRVEATSSASTASTPASSAPMVARRLSYPAAAAEDASRSQVSGPPASASAYSTTGADALRCEEDEDEVDWDGSL